MRDFIDKLMCREWNWKKRVILIQGKLRISEQQFFKAIRYATDAYREHGIEKDDRVLLMIPAGTQLYVTLFSLWCIGATGVVLDSDMEQPTIKVCLERAKVKKVICVEKAIKLFEGTLDMMENVIPCDNYVQFEQDGSSVTEIPISPEKEALISFTSGSTGVPKGIVRTFGFLERQREEIRKWFLYEKHDVDFAVMPVFTITNFIFGTKTILSVKNPHEPKNIASVLKQIKREQVNRIILSPFLAEEMVKYGRKEIFNMPCVKKVFLGGGPVYKKLIKDVRMLFPNAIIYLLYGCSEVEPIALYQMEEITQEQYENMDSGNGLIGGTMCQPCTVIRNESKRRYGNISIEEFDSLKLQGEVGEILVSGNNVLSGYMDGVGDEENKIKVEDAIWHRTGDLGRIGNDGILYLYGRAKEAVACNGQMYYPFSVESQVYAKYNVERVAFLGYEGKKVLVIQASDEEWEKIDGKENEFECDAMVRITKMPMDRKHGSKIDYGVLRGLL